MEDKSLRERIAAWIAGNPKRNIPIEVSLPVQSTPALAEAIIENAEAETLPARIPENNFAGNPIFSISYSGEKNLGELGPVIDYRPNFEILRFRSWQSFLESEITQMVIRKYLLWVLGSGLKLKTAPAKLVLKSEGITVDAEEFNDITEARFEVYANSTAPDFADMQNLHKIGRICLKNAIIGGDVLVILRYQNDNITVQLIDGSQVRAPLMSAAENAAATARGNTIKNGVEVSAKGEHIAYYVAKPNTFYQFDRIEAKSGGPGLTQAFLVYGMEYRLDYVRGLPMIAAVLETLKKLDRYKEATVASAEERQKIAYYIQHGIGSTGENPLAKQITRAFKTDITEDLPVDIDGNQLANKIAVSTNKQVFNMPNDSKLESLESTNELHFKDFYSVNIDLVCAALMIPPNVALSKYDSNFSASRAALKDWEHTIRVSRDDFATQFYKRIYDYWLEIQILNNKIQAPGFMMGRLRNLRTVIDAYKTATFLGPNVPHIDPLKEVKAEREKLGPLGNSIPLTTVEAATEAVNGGNSDENMEQFAEELAQADELGIFKYIPSATTGEPAQNPPEGDPPPTD